MPFITDNETDLDASHYVTNATAENHFYNFYERRLHTFRTRHGDDFCLVINGSRTTDDVYVLPFGSFQDFFSDDYLDLEQRRWVGTITGNRIRLTAKGRPTKSRSVGEFYNAFTLLDGTGSTVGEDIVVYGDAPGSVDDLRELIQRFNHEYADARPQKQVSLSERVGRPNAITDYLKALHKHTCQICRQAGFAQSNGALYSEAHHIIPLHQLIPGSLLSDNIVIVCPTCHRKLHYAHVTYEGLDTQNVVIRINAVQYTFARNIVSNDMTNVLSVSGRDSA
jgi:hypothetical protein